MQQSDTEKEERFGLKLNPIRPTHFPFNALNAFADFSQLMDDIGDAWTSGKTYAVGDYCISGNRLYKCKTAHTAGSAFNASYWDSVNVTGEISTILGNILQMKVGDFYTEKAKGHTIPESYGKFLRISGTSWPGTGAFDTYYLGVGSGSNAYVGVQVNGATEITWTRLANA